MKQLIFLLSGAIVLAAGFAGAGFALSGVWLGLLLAAAWLGFWLTSLVRQYRAEGTGVGSIALFSYAILAIYAVATGVWPGWLMPGLVAVVAAWDLEFFILRLRDVQDNGQVDIMITQHVRRLALVAVVSLVLAGAAAIIRYNLTFGMAVAVGLLAVFAVSRFMAALRQTRP